MGVAAARDAPRAAPPARGHAAFGADVTFRQFVKLVFALGLGTTVEWYDFTIYSQLATTLTAVFFPSSDPSIEQLKYWGVYAVGFISRPLGAVIFGHVGDYYGRRVTLLFSILFITVPTLLIGALPSYAHIGIAAPILMALLRFIQGCAVGGEFGSAITYLFEMAPVGRKGITASLGQLAIAPGIILGIIACQIVLYACSPTQLLVWGWRLPFLVTAFTAPLCLILRMHMPEPYEYLQNRQHMVLQRVASTAARRVAASYVKQNSRAGSTTGALTPQLSTRQVSLRLQRSVSLTNSPAGPVLSPTHSWRRSSGDDGAAAAAAAGCGQHGAKPEPHCHVDLAAADAPLGCEAQYEAEVQRVQRMVKHHVPLMVLARDHWRGVLLQFLLEANYGTFFYIVFSWAPPYLHSTLGAPTTDTLWALLIAMVLFATVVGCTGHFICDSNAPKVWVFMGVTAVVAAVVFPVFVCMQSAAVTSVFAGSGALGMWLLLPLCLALCGGIGGLMTSIGPQVFPAAVRATGYNLAHNLAMSLFGGLSPLAVSALAVVLQPPAYAAAVIVLITAVITWVAAVLLVKVAPQTNARCPSGAQQAALEPLREEPGEAEQQQQPALQKVLVVDGAERDAAGARPSGGRDGRDGKWVPF